MKQKRREKLPKEKALITNIKDEYFKYVFKTKVQMIYAVDPPCLQGLICRFNQLCMKNFFFLIFKIFFNFRKFQKAKLEFAAHWQVFT